MCRLKTIFIFRTYLLLNYADLDPDCVKTISNATNTSDTQTSLSVTISSPNVDIVFHVPKPDMRHPHDIGQEWRSKRDFWNFGKVAKSILGWETIFYHVTYSLHLINPCPYSCIPYENLRENPAIFL